MGVPEVRQELMWHGTGCWYVGVAMWRLGEEEKEEEEVEMADKGFSHLVSTTTAGC
jgi:hypothetical protein